MQPEAQDDRRRQAERLLELLTELPEAQREAVLLKEEAGLSLEEIAQATGTGRETVKSRLRYAMARLRQGLRGAR
ncbi:MAG: sigma-70 family RNA polymerase sigma factor [Candidatus Competibacteraceae bacterium]